jgi:hypothetical protein
MEQIRGARPGKDEPFPQRLTGERQFEHDSVDEAQN